MSVGLGATLGGEAPSPIRVGVCWPYVTQYGFLAMDQVKEAVEKQQEASETNSSSTSGAPATAAVVAPGSKPPAPPFTWSTNLREVLHDLLRAFEAWIVKAHGFVLSTCLTIALTLDLVLRVTCATMLKDAVCSVTGSLFATPRIHRAVKTLCRITTAFFGGCDTIFNENFMRLLQEGDTVSAAG